MSNVTGAPTIREYDPARDRPALRALFIELHETERRIDPRMRASEDIADAYLEKLFERNREWDGRILMAEREGAVAGYVCVWCRYDSKELDDPPGEMGYVSDLVVGAHARGLGFGRALLRAAEEQVRARGVGMIRLSVLAGNREAISLYESEGFATVEHDLEKPLDGGG